MMENIVKYSYRGLLRINTEALKITTRNANRINVQKPRPPQYERAKYEYLVRPKYFERGEREAWFLPLESQCIKEEEVTRLQQQRQEDNPYQRLLAKDLRNWFENSKLIAFFHANPIKFDPRFEVEVRLRKENMYLKKLGKKTVEMAIEGTPFISIMPLFVSHTEMVFCHEPNVDKLMKIVKKMHNHVLLAAIVEDRLLSVSQLKALAQLKDLTTARAQLAGVLTAVQTQLVSGLTYHQSNIAAGLQQYAEKQPERPESTPGTQAPASEETSEQTS